MAYFGAALTLPGIAGVILTIGVGIDSNVLIFERIREELRAGKTAVCCGDHQFRPRVHYIGRYTFGGADIRDIPVPLR